MTDQPKTAVSKLTIIAYCVLFTAVAGIVLLAMLGTIEAAMAPRLMGIVFGLIMIVTGNVLPKIIDPVHSQPLQSRFQRTIGWTLVLSGVALVVMLPFLPNENVALAGLVIGGGGLALAGALVFGSRWESRTNSPTQSVPTQVDLAISNHAALLRTTAFDILHGIAWAFIFLSVATLWGKDGLIWTWIGFAVSMAIFPIAKRPMPATRA